MPETSASPSCQKGDLGGKDEDEDDRDTAGTGPVLLSGSAPPTTLSPGREREGGGKAIEFERAEQEQGRKSITERNHVQDKAERNRAKQDGTEKNIPG